jgi:prepilin-type N-terminal cleavage/methylation domain-containing protein
MDTHRARRTFTSHRRGFTLVELLVVTAILTILTAVVLANNAKFGGVIRLRNLGYDMALTARQAQVYGISVRRFGTGATKFTSSYGMHFESGSPSTYIMFADVNGNGIYDNAGEIVQTYTIGSGFSISSLCATPTGGTEACGLSKLDVAYQRPEPDARIYANGGGSLQQAARVEVRSPRNDKLSLLFEVTGQISVGQTVPGN